MSDNAPQEFVTAPRLVEALKITEENIQQVAKWCKGRIKGESIVFPGIRDRSKVLAGSDSNRYAVVGQYVVRVKQGFDVQSAEAFEATHRPATTRAKEKA